MGKKSSKTKTTNEPPKWAVPYLQGAMGTISNTVGANQGHLDEMASTLRGFLPGLGERAFGDNPALSAATNYATDVIGGKFLDQQNPYLQGVIDSTSNDVQDRVNSMMARSGNSLATTHQGVLAKELASAQNNLRYGNYAQERQNQQSAAGMLPALNAAQYSGVMPYLAATQGAAGLPFTGIQNLGQIGSLVGGFGTQTSTQPGGWGTGLLGAASNMFSFAPISLSERAAKTDIVEDGPWDDRGDGLMAHFFRYKNDETRTIHRGVMADDVEAKRPWALGPRLANGWRTVNYAKLSEAA